MNWFLTILLILLFLLLFYISYKIYSFYNPSFSFYDDTTFDNCKYRRWGCCPDGITTKLDDQGTNCYPKNNKFL